MILMIMAMNLRLKYLSVLLTMALCASGETFYSTYLNGFAHFSHDSCARQADHMLQIDNSTDAPIMVLDTIAHDPAASFRFVARFANLHNAEGKSYRYFQSPSGKSRKISNTEWGVVWNYVDSLNYCRLALRGHNSNLHDILDERTLSVSISRVCNGTASILKQLSLRKNVSLYEDFNTVHIALSDSATTILLGNDKLSLIASLPQIPLVTGSRFGVYSGKGALVAIDRMVIQSTHSPAGDLTTRWTAQSLNEHFAASSDPIEGYWDYLDRSLNESQLRLGGRYRIALVKSPTGYDIIYVSGAEVDEHLWRTGMLKGSLTPTRFIDNYALLWYDTEKQPFAADVHATIENVSILTLHFPLAGSQMRFSKSADGK